MKGYGKTSERLAELGQRVIDVRRMQREASFDRAADQRELETLRKQREEAAIAAEQVVIEGQPVPDSEQLRDLTAKIAKLEESLSDDAWAAKNKALERTGAQRDSEREAFAREHRDQLLVELEAADAEATEGLRRAYAGVLEALDHRQAVAGDLDEVLKHYPPLYEGSNACRGLATTEARAASATTSASA